MLDLEFQTLVRVCLGGISCQPVAYLQECDSQPLEEYSHMSLLAACPRPTNLVTESTCYSVQGVLYETLDAYVSYPGAARTKAIAAPAANGVFRDRCASQQCIRIRHTVSQSLDGRRSAADELVAVRPERHDCLQFARSVEFKVRKGSPRDHRAPIEPEKSLCHRSFKGRSISDDRA
ncbi:hypothetical protein JQ634_00915 [Bradyrhizobium sp. AUGA SZCCT0240]|uniref:hypothetical protein n=1 Tax=Bradyrhizobium sp. AUGA SZCCT0240 TaxID=2807669 RepID=UPI001BA6366A|nr:hypothetical protein [Bradyrhizobium sp. AUGA SZCCT0240]MBR1252258.1 hypothetical protein [Bradyrhizobium sp. AUGA SZCCT0240]